MSALVETMFYVGAIPWHGEGDAWKLDRPATSQEAMIASGLNWRIETRPLFRELPVFDDERGLRAMPGAAPPVGPTYQKVPEGQVVVRATDNQVLGVVGPRWTPVQNEDAFNWFDPLVQDGLALYHTAGSLKGGRVVWILAQIGENRHVIGDDYIGQFLLLSIGHDGTRGVQLMPTPIRVVCANTLNAAERTAEDVKTQLKFAHTTNVVRRLGETREFIRPFLQNFEHTTEVFQLLAKAQVTPEAADVYLNSLFPDPEKSGDDNDARKPFAEKVRDQVLAKFEGDLLGYEAIPQHLQRTYWTLYNAVTEYVDHERGSDKHRLTSLWTGSGVRVKEQALELAVAAM